MSFSEIDYLESETAAQVMSYTRGFKPLEFFILPEKLNPFHEHLDIFAVSACRFDGGSKFITVRGLLAYAKILGKLEGVTELFEATSGNTGLALAQQALHPPFSMKKVTLVVSPDIPAAKKTMLHLFGAEVIPPKSGLGTIGTARSMGGGGWSQDSEKWKHDNGAMNLDQYACPGNWLLHEMWTGPRILERVEGVDIFATSVGTGGTIIGVGSFLRKNSNAAIVGVACAPGDEIPGARDQKRMKEVSLPWRENIHALEEVGQKQAYAAAAWLNQITGQPVGPTGGMALAGLLSYVKKNCGTILSRHKKKAVFFIPDGPERYGDRFEANLPSGFFSGMPEAPLPWDSIWGEWSF